MRKIVIYISYAIFSSVAISVLEFDIYFTFATNMDKFIIQMLLIVWMFLTVFVFAQGKK